jgi:hypothetical protein
MAAKLRFGLVISILLTFLIGFHGAHSART